ncbi:hypothetical protein AH02_45 [Pseudomonas phage AH02]|nr:hypothetical protein AH02_45 [Pseudomonas phage AH02]
MIKDNVNAWQSIETCPTYDEVLFYREDCGVLLGRFCDRDTLMDDKERDEWEGTEEQLYQFEYWAFGQWGVELLDGSEVPTHWIPLPVGPELQP